MASDLVIFSVSFESLSGSNVTFDLEFDKHQLLVKTVEQHIGNQLYVGQKIEGHYRPILYVDDDGNQILVNANFSDFQEFLEFVSDTPSCDATKFKLKVLNDCGQLLVAGKIQNWKEYTKQRLVDMNDILKLFESFVLESDMGEVQREQKNATFNLKGREPPNAIESNLFTNPLALSGSLAVKRISAIDAMQLIRSGNRIIIPLNDGTFATASFSEILIGPTFYGFQETINGMYKCEALKIPVTVRRRFISDNNKELLFARAVDKLCADEAETDNIAIGQAADVGKEPSCFKEISLKKDTVYKKLMKTKVDSDDVQPCCSKQVCIQKSQTTEIGDPCDKPSCLKKNTDISDQGNNDEVAVDSLHDTDSDSSVNLSFDELNVTDTDGGEFVYVDALDLPACFSAKADVNSQETIRAFIKRFKLADSRREPSGPSCQAQSCGKTESVPIRDHNYCQQLRDDKSSIDKDAVAEPIKNAYNRTPDNASVQYVQANSNKSADNSTPTNENINTTPSDKTNSSYNHIEANSEHSPVNIVPDTLIQVTSNVIKSVFNTLKLQPEPGNMTPSAPADPVSNPVQQNMPANEPQQNQEPGGMTDINGLNEQLQQLHEMGFLNSSHNKFLLQQYPNDINRVLESLLNFNID